MPSPWCSINIYKINELYWIQGSWLGLLPDLEAGTLQQCKCLILLDLKDFCSCLHLSSDCKVHDNDSLEPSCSLYLNGSCCLQPGSRAGVAVCAGSHVQVCCCVCADGLCAYDVGSPAGRLRLFPSHRKRGGRAQGFSYPMFLCCGVRTGRASLFSCHHQDRIWGRKESL